MADYPLPFSSFHQIRIKEEQKMIDRLLEKMLSATRQMREQIPVPDDVQFSDKANRIRENIMSLTLDFEDASLIEDCFRESLGVEWYEKTEKREWKPVKWALFYCEEINSLLLITLVESRDDYQFMHDNGASFSSVYSELVTIDRPATDTEVIEFYEEWINDSKRSPRDCGGGGNE